MTLLSGRAECCWIATDRPIAYPQFDHSGRTEVAVVGAGIVGLTVALLLCRAGVAVTVLEGRQIGRQVTGRSSAKVTAQHTLIYRRLIDTLGIDQAQRYADANRSGVELIRRMVNELDIVCDYAPKDAYVYTADPERRLDIEAEAETARRLGLEADVLEYAPLPFKTVAALRFRDQAQFNPMRYLTGLAAAVLAAGGRVFENTRVTAVKPGSHWRLSVGRHHLDADKVVIATNIPIAGPVPYSELTQPRCHIAAAFRARSDNLIDGMFIGIDEPTRSLRMGRDTDGPLLVALGPRFNTGQDGDVVDRFRELESWVRTNLLDGELAWHWVNEDYETADRVPFAGDASKDRSGLYVATGFNGWGISNGTATAALIADEIQGKLNPWSALYDPRRHAKNCNKGGESQSMVSHVRAIKPGEGGVVRRGRGKLAVRRGADGVLHALSAACTHMGCTVTWNNAEQTWDCPCHGSIFAADGAVIHGPAVTPLAAKKLPANWTRVGAKQSLRRS